MIEPCIPRAWKGFEMSFKYHSARYDIAVEHPRGVCRGVTRLELDGEALTTGTPRIGLDDDGVTHRIRIVLG
jgi:cyclic beta-1,2-glucan synthetase